MRHRWLGVVMVVVGLLIPMTPAGAGTAVLGGRIVFIDAFGGSGIYTIAPDGTDRTLVAEGSNLRHPRWMPDGSGISYLETRRLYAFRLVTVDPSGGNRTTVIGPHDLPEGWAIGSYAWSPDAGQLVLALSEVGCCGRRLYLASADGSILGRIATGMSEPDWSSTGRIVAAPRVGLVTMDPDGGNVDLVVPTGNDRRPRWSPDGSRIVFERAEGNGDVWVVNADGSGRANVTRSPDIYDWSPSWSPDGRHIVWSPAPPGEPFAFADLWLMRASGRGQTPIAETKRLDEYDADWASVPV